MSTPYVVFVADGYLTLEQYRNVPAWVACNPWGIPFAIRMTKAGAQSACDIAKKSKLMQEWYKMNKEMGIDHYGDFSVVMLNLPSLIDIVSIAGELVKSTQVGPLPPSERGVHRNSDYNKWEGLDDNPSDNRPDID